MNEKEYLTQEKFDEFKKELDQLKNVRRKEVAESLEYSKALGDLAENAEYHEARDMQATIEDRIAKLEELLKNVVIIKSHENTGTVNIGSTVTVEKDGKTLSYIIVGSEEADVMTNKISVRSPFGQAVLGKKSGDKFSFIAPNGELFYKVTDVK